MQTPVLALVALLSLVLSVGAHALDSDRKQAIEIQADRAELDEKTGEARYEGQVVLVQGSLTIKADLLVLKADGSQQLTAVVATGKPATFSQTPEAGKPPVTARASTIDYQVARETLLLQGQAVVVQNNNVFQGERIEYDIPHQRMQASSSGSTTGGRVKMTLPPSSKDDSGKAGAP
jgi:lipopolysaccharide export system protein LptA